MKKRILSIDFDYFIDADLQTRNDKFPDGEDDKPKTQLDAEWKYFYDTYPEIKDIGVNEDTFSIIKNFLSGLRFGEVIEADSHREIGKIFPNISNEDDLEVIHIDFHHDNYISGGNNLDCANWLRILMNDRSITNTDITWIRKEDSETSSMIGEFPYKHTTDFVVEGEFDYIFICFSPEWTPPHLRPKYAELCRCVSHLVVE